MPRARLRAVTWPAITAEMAGGPGPRRLAAGGVHHCRRPGFAVDLWRRGQAGRRPFGAAARFSAIIAAGKPPVPAQPASSDVQVAAAEAAPPQPTRTAQTTTQDAARTATAALPDHTQLLQTMARNLANMERSIEQLKASQQQIASDNSKAIEELKASQEEIKRVLARVSEQSPPTSPPPTQPTSTVRKPKPIRPCASLSGRVSRRRRESGLDT